ncbi:MAG: hypothetical protein K0S65_3572, partial [Labilithrix sp.]|nr:hypothetical protein [Labilithrix sp.]
MKTRLGWILAVATLVGCIGTKNEGEAAIAEGSTESTTLAVVPYGNGKIVFIDEGRVIPGAGISFVEIGDVDISDLLDVQDATALEVFLALSPKGVMPP